MKRVLSVAVFALWGAGTAQLQYRGSLELAVDATLNAAIPSPQAGWTLAGNLALDYDLEPVLLTAVLDPSARIDRTGVTLEPGLTEAYALTSQGDFDLSAGVERLPLETARLSIPFGLERTDTQGTRRGVPGVRVSYFVDDWRLRGVAFYQDVSASVTPVVSARRSFGDFELEAHVLYPQEVVVGLGGSGLVADLVLYGEVWLLTDPVEGRGAVGLSGNLHTGSWTLEAAYFSPGERNLKDDSDAEIAARQVDMGQTGFTDPRPILLGQLAWPLGDAGDMSLTLFGNAALDPDAVRAQTSATYSFAASEQEVSLSAGGSFGPEPFTLRLNFGVKQFF